MYPVLVFTYQDEGANRRRSLLVVLTVAFAALAIKLVSFESFSFNVRYLDLIITNNSTALTGVRNERFSKELLLDFGGIAS
jgi:hypothetical protein